MLPITSIQRRIRESISSLTEQAATHKHQLQKVDDDLKISRENFEKLSQQTKIEEKRFAFFADLKLYILDLISCLDEKV